MEKSQVNKRLRVRDIIICSDCDRGFDPRYVWAVVLTNLVYFTRRTKGAIGNDTSTCRTVRHGIN